MRLVSAVIGRRLRPRGGSARGCHAVVVPDGVERDGGGGPGERPEVRRIGEERHQGEHLGHRHRLAAGPGRDGAGPVGQERRREGDRGDDIAQQHAQDLVPLEPAAEGHDAERRGHEQLVRHRVDDRAERGAAEPPRELAVEQVAGRGRAQEGQPGVVGDERKREGQRDPDRAQQVRRGPSRTALLALAARTRFGRHGVQDTSMMVDTAVIPCGGRGTRLHPITRWLPKEILPVGLRPILHWTLDEAADAGLLRAIIVTNPHKPLLEAAARNYEGPLELEFVPQDHPRGLGDALLRARDHLAGSPFLALLPDNLFTGPNPTAAVAATFRATRLTHGIARRDRAGDGRHQGADRPGNDPERAGRLPPGHRLADKTADRFDTAGDAAAVTPIGRMAFPGEILEEFDEVEPRAAAGGRAGRRACPAAARPAERAGRRDQPGGVLRRRGARGVPRRGHVLPTARLTARAPWIPSSTITSMSSPRSAGRGSPT